jgi:anaerobic selenocysteine-containing dehydrogenase
MARAFAKTPLTVAIGTKLNRSMVVPGRRALILPCLGRSERDVQASGPQVVTVEDSMSMVHASEGRLDPASKDLRSEVAIVCGLAGSALRGRSTVPWAALPDDYAAIRAMIERVVPGFERYEERARRPGGFWLGNPAASRTFPTASGKAHLTAHPLPVLDVPPGRLAMMTVRSHDQFNTVVYDDDDRYRGVFGGRMVVFVHPADLAALGLEAGQLVTITSHFRGETRSLAGFSCVPFEIARGCCATYFPEANALIPLESFAEGSRTPTSKNVTVSLSPAPSP